MEIINLANNEENMHMLIKVEENFKGSLYFYTKIDLIFYQDMGELLVPNEDSFQKHFIGGQDLKMTPK